MSEDIAFQIQLGIILPKMKEKLSDSVFTIVEELAKTISAGSTEENSPFPLDAAKSIFLKDFEIFIDKSIMPLIKEKYLPPPPAEPSEESSQQTTE